MLIAACHPPATDPSFAYTHTHTRARARARARAHSRTRARTHAHTHTRTHAHTHTSSPYWELEQRLNGTADDIVALPSGWIAVKNRDTLIESEEAGGLAAATAEEAGWFANTAKLDPALAASNTGIVALLSKIDGLISEHMKKVGPSPSACLKLS